MGLVIALNAPKIAYQPLPKAACTSVKQALAQIDPEAEAEAAHGLTAAHDRYPTTRFRPRAWAKQAQAGAWRFCVVRDPAVRLMSSYTDLVLGRDALCHSPRLRRSTLPLQPDADTFFANLALYRANSSLVKHHVLGAEHFLGPDLARDYDRVFRTSELAELAAALSWRAGRPVRMPRSNRSEGRLSLHDLGGHAIDAIRPLLEEEYALLSGFYENPLGSRVYGPCVVTARRVS